MKFARRLRALCLLVYLGIPGVCIAQQDNDYFSKLPANTVYSLLESVDGFTPIVCEVSGKTNDTIWAENLVQPPMWKIQVDMNDESVFVLSQNKKGKKAYMKNASYPKDAMKKGKEGLVLCTPMFREAFSRPKRWKQSTCPLVDKLWCIHTYSGILFSLKKTFRHMLQHG